MVQYVIAYHIISTYAHTMFGAAASTRSFRRVTLRDAARRLFAAWRPMSDERHFWRRLNGCLVLQVNIPLITSRLTKQQNPKTAGKDKSRYPLGKVPV